MKGDRSLKINGHIHLITKYLESTGTKSKGISLHLIICKYIVPELLKTLKKCVHLNIFRAFPRDTFDKGKKNGVS